MGLADVQLYDQPSLLQFVANKNECNEILGQAGIASPSPPELDFDRMVPRAHVSRLR